ncbi:MAG: PilZ domain-containing protein [Pseudomonadota bacterium]
MYGSFASLADGPISNIGRRAAARLRLSIPAKLITVYETQRCVLLDLSRTGARIGLARPLDVGDAGFLRFADFEQFGGVVRNGQGINGLEFDLPLDDEDVIKVRHFAEGYAFDERRALRQEVREWVEGRNRVLGK